VRLLHSQHTPEHERVNKLTLFCVAKDARTALRQERVRQQTRKRVPSIVPREERRGHGGLAVSSWPAHLGRRRRRGWRPRRWRRRRSCPRRRRGGARRGGRRRRGSRGGTGCEAGGRGSRPLRLLPTGTRRVGRRRSRRRWARVGTRPAAEPRPPRAAGTARWTRSSPRTERPRPARRRRRSRRRWPERPQRRRPGPGGGTRPRGGGGGERRWGPWFGTARRFGVALSKSWWWVLRGGGGDEDGAVALASRRRDLIRPFERRFTGKAYRTAPVSATIRAAPAAFHMLSAWQHSCLQDFRTSLNFEHTSLTKLGIASHFPRNFYRNAW
jgi:hypothetical protein